MARKKKDESQQSGSEYAEAPFTDEIEGAGEAAEETPKQWTKRPDPFGIETIVWPDGYRISLKESDSNREIFIRFGSGQKCDQPKAFDAIKKLLKEEYGMYWDAKVQGWAKEIKPGITPLIKEQNKRVRAAVDEAFSKAIELEEQARGPSVAQPERERGGISM